MGSLGEAVMSKDYNKAAHLQTSATQQSLNLLVESIADVPLPSPGKPLQVLDLGCSHGINSIQPVQVLLEGLVSRLRSSRGDDGAKQRLDVQVYHEDLPTNNFSALMALLQDPAKTYLPHIRCQAHDASDSNIPEQARLLSVYSACIGRSFYEQVLPSSSFHVAFAFTCLHWIPGLGPTPSTDAIFAHNSADPAVRDAWARFTADSLHLGLVHRGAEAAPGAHFFAHFPCCVKGIMPWGQEPIEAAARDMVQAGLLTPSDIAGMNNASFVLYEQEIQEVLARADVAGAWEVLYCQVHQLDNPAWLKYLEQQQQQGSSGAADSSSSIASGDRSVSPAKELADTYAAQHWAVLEGQFVDALTRARGGDREVGQRLVGELFSRYRARLEACPQQEVNHWIYLHLRRRG